VNEVENRTLSAIDPASRDDLDRLQSGFRRRSRNPLPPRSFTARRRDGGVEFRIIDRDPIAEGNGSIRYDIYWSEDVDLSSAETIAAGYARATQVESIQAPGKEGADASRTIYGEKYLRGYYYCVGVDSAGGRGEPTPPIAMGDDSTGGGYPDDVEHFAVSESGEVHNGVPYSVISFVYQAPNDERFAGVKFFVKDYPVLNEIYQTHFHRHTGARGGTGQDKFKWEVGRRKGTGTLSLALDVMSGVGTEFQAEMNAGDHIEARGTTAAVLSLANNTSGLLSAWWSGLDVISLADWYIIPAVTIYAVSVGKDGSHREDIENAKSAVVWLDGLLSPPVAPVLIGNYDSNGVSTLGETNRLEWDQLEGTEIKQYHLFRGEGAAVPFESCTLVHTQAHDPNELANGHHYYDDTDFTIVQKESHQVWTYYLLAENWREQRSAASNAIEIACRLNNSGSGDPTIPARSGVLNILYNAALAGVSGSNVDSADVNQDTFNAMGGPPSGWARWHGAVYFAAVTRPQHLNNDQVKFFPPTAAGTTFVYQNINGASGVPAIIRNGALLTFQGLVKHGGVVPDGYFGFYVETFNGAAHNEYCARRYRNSSDALDWITGPSARVNIPTTDLLSTWQLFFAVFRIDTSFTATTLRANFGWDSGTVGNIYVTQPMLTFGEELCNWTGQMVDTALRYPKSGNPFGGIGDGPGRRGEIIVV
jgi:hypothetical protein